MSTHPGASLLLAGRYRLGAEVGRGGSGHVHQGIDTRLGRAVAIKLLHPEAARSPEARRLFAEEQAALAAMDHPGVVRLLDGDLEPSAGTPWAVHSLVRGRTLHEVVSAASGEGHAVPPAWAVARMADLLDVLEHVHSAGYVHGDLSAGNVMVADDDRVVVLDVGSTRVGDVSRTPATMSYASPERLSGGALGPASDVFSVGALLHHLLAARPPFATSSGDPGGSARQLVGLAPSLNATRPGLPRHLDRLVLRALAKDPSERPLVDELRCGLASVMPRLEALEGGRVEPAPRSAAERTPPLVLAVGPVTATVPRPTLGRVTTEPSVGPSLSGAGSTSASRARGRPGLLVLVGAVATGVALAVVTVIGGDDPVRPEARAVVPSTSATATAPVVAVVPSLLGLSVTEAEQRLVAAGFVLGRTSEADGPHRVGSIIGATPTVGDSAARGTPVDLVLASGRSAIPDVVAMSLAEARDALVRAGFAVSWRIVGASADGVLSSSPDPGAAADNGSTVELLVGAAEGAVSTPSPFPSATASSGPGDPDPSSSPLPTPSPSPTGEVPVAG